MCSNRRGKNVLFQEWRPASFEYLICLYHKIKSTGEVTNSTNRHTYPSLFPFLMHTQTLEYVHTYDQPNASTECRSIRYDIRVVRVCAEPVRSADSPSQMGSHDLPTCGQFVIPGATGSEGGGVRSPACWCVCIKWNLYRFCLHPQAFTFNACTPCITVVLAGNDFIRRLRCQSERLERQ